MREFGRGVEVIGEIGQLRQQTIGRRLRIRHQRHGMEGLPWLVAAKEGEAQRRPLLKALVGDVKLVRGRFGRRSDAQRERVARNLHGAAGGGGNLHGHTDRARQVAGLEEVHRHPRGADRVRTQVEDDRRAVRIRENRSLLLGRIEQIEAGCGQAQTHRKVGVQGHRGDGRAVRRRLHGQAHDDRDARGLHPHLRRAGDVGVADDGGGRGPRRGRGRLVVTFQAAFGSSGAGLHRCQGHDQAGMSSRVVAEDIQDRRPDDAGARRGDMRQLVA